METKILKQIMVGLLSVVSSSLMWKFFAQITLHGGYAHALQWVWFVIALAAAEGFLFLLALGRTTWMVWLISILNAALLLIFFGHGVGPLIAAGCFVLAGGMVSSFPKAIESSVSGAYHHSAYRLSWPLALVILGFASYLFAGIVTPARIASLASNYGFSSISANVAPFNTDQTVDAYLVMQYQQGGVAHPTPEMLAEGRKQLEDQIGVQITGNEKMSDVGKQFISGKVQTALTNTGFGTGRWYYLLIVLIILLPLLRLIIAVGSDVFILIGEAIQLVYTGERQVTVKTFDL